VFAEQLGFGAIERPDRAICREEPRNWYGPLVPSVLSPPVARLETSWLFGGALDHASVGPNSGLAGPNGPAPQIVPAIGDRRVDTDAHKVMMPVV
jgi:hypothetical protein